MIDRLKKKLGIAIEILKSWIYNLARETTRYLRIVLFQLQTSEGIFLLLFSTIIGLGSGFGAILFRWLISFFKNIFFIRGEDLLSFMGSYYILIIPAAGGLLVGVLVYFFASETKGHGVPEVMLAVATGGSRIRPRVAAMKALVSAICIGSGGSVGREGPIVQISSAMGSTLGQIFRLSEDKRKILIACGAAGGIAATFNAPLAGIFFGLEVILREYGTRYFSSVVLSAVTATVISRTFLGNNPAFITPKYEIIGGWDILFYFVLGLLAAVTAWIFIKSLYKTEDLFEAIKIPPYLKPAIGGLMLGMIGLFFPQIFGVGYESIESSLNGQLGFVVVLGLLGLKIVATSITLGSGGSGGVFAPSLFIGAMLGSSFGYLLQFLFPSIPFSTGAFALVGMAAVFAGAGQAPISAMLILFEMTSDYKIILPLLISCVISTLVLKGISKDSIYTLKLRRRGIDILKINREDMTEKILVSEVMFRKVHTVTDSTTVRNAGLMIKSTTHRGFPVLSSEGRLVGIVTQQDINKALNSGKAEILVSEIMTKDLICCYSDETLKEALLKFGEKDIGRIPVVDRENPDQMIGLITRKGVITAFNQEFNKD